MTNYMTRANTAAEIVEEAKAITVEQRKPIELARQQKVLALRKATGLEYAVSVEKAMYQLEIIDFSGKKVEVKEIGEAMPLYEFAAFIETYKHAEI